MTTLSFDADDEELALFLAETNDHLLALDQNIVRLETAPNDQALLQSIFRSAHTIKGGAGMIGHARMTALAHAMENVLDGLRAGALGVTPGVIDALLAALDALRVLVKEVMTRTQSAIALDPLTDALRACLTPANPPANPTNPANPANPTNPVAPAPAALQVEEAPPSTPRVRAIFSRWSPRHAPSLLGAPASSRQAIAGERVANSRRRSPDRLPAGRSADRRRRSQQRRKKVARTPTPPSRVEDASLPAGVDPAHVYDVTVEIDRMCGLSAARTMQAYLELARATRILRVDPTLDEIEADDTTSAFAAVVVTADLPSLIEHQLSSIADVLVARVTPLAQHNGAVADAVPGGAGEAGEMALEGVTLPPPSPTTTASKTTAAETAAPAAPAVPAPTTRTPQAKPAQETVRVAVGIVDNLMNLTSELVLARTRLQTLGERLMARYAGDEGVAALADAVGRLDAISTDLQATVMKARMLPVETVFSKFPRLMRDLAAQSGKQVAFTMAGQDTELDRSVIEQLSDPLIHLLRNAIDHGMEPPDERVAVGKDATGAIALTASARENHILITVRDDGPGIDGAKVKASAVTKGLITAEAAAALDEQAAQELIFAPGLSTARAITDISGRGVGMDIVKASLERMGGQVRIDSTVGAGTTFSITLPLTLAIMQALLVTVDETVYALPLTLVTEILSVPEGAIQTLQGTEVTLVRDAILPIVRLRDYFGRPPHAAASAHHIVSTRADGRALGLMVDGLIGEQEIVMKPLGAYIGAVRGLAGATILGDGRIGLLVDVPALRGGDPRQAAAVAA